MDSSWNSTASIVLSILLQILSCSGASETMGAFNVEHRITHGVPAELNNSAHIVSIRRKKGEEDGFGWGHHCAGSLITSSVVLSACRCFMVDYELIAAQKLMSVMGTLDIHTKTANTLSYNITRYIYDEDKFNPGTGEADILIIFLDGTVPANHPAVKPIQLNHKTLRPGTMCQISGWGLNEEREKTTYLMTTNVPIIAKSDCITENITEYGHRENQILDGMMCVGYMKGGPDSCHGDEGGPLVCDNVLGGVISWKKGCGRQRRPGIYMDVAFYVPWIEAQLKEPRASLPGRAPNFFRGSFPLLSLLAPLFILL